MKIFRRINILFLLIPVLVYVLFAIYSSINRGSANFFGVAENQETQINLEHASTVTAIHVTEGEFVSKGTLLMEVTRLALDYKMSELSHDIAELTARDRLERDEINSSLEHYRAIRAEKSGDILSRIRVRNPRS